MIFKASSGQLPSYQLGNYYIYYKERHQKIEGKLSQSITTKTPKIPIDLGIRIHFVEHEDRSQDLRYTRNNKTVHFLKLK